MASALPFQLVALCERLAAAVTSAGQRAGWRIQQFGRSGFNTDVIVGATILKITTEGSPAPDGSGAFLRLRSSAGEQRFPVHLGADGELELSNELAEPVSIERFLEAVGQACGAPLRTTAALPHPLARFYEQLVQAIVTAGQAHGWRVRTFGMGANVDVIVGTTIFKVEGRGAPAPDGSGAELSLGSQTVLQTRVTRSGRLELCDREGRSIKIDRLIELIAEGSGSPLSKGGAALAPPLARLCERLASQVVKGGLDHGWVVRLYGQRGFNADAAVGPNIVKITTRPTDPADGATFLIKRPGYERSFSTRGGKEGELELTDDSGATVTIERFLASVAEACNTPLKAEARYPEPLARLCEDLVALVANFANAHGRRFRRFGHTGVNADVAIGTELVKVTTEGIPASDGSGVTVRIARPGWEWSSTTRVGRGGELGLADASGSIERQRFVERLAEASQARLDERADLPTPLLRLCETIASAVGSAADERGWRVRPFGTGGYSADVQVGALIVKVTLEAKALAGSTGALLRIRRSGHERTFQCQLSPDGEFKLADDGGHTVSMEDMVHALEEACRP